MREVPIRSSVRSLSKTSLVVLGTLGVLVAPHLGVPMVLYPLFGLGLCTVMLHGQGLRWADTGFRWRGLGVRALLVGGCLGVLYAAVNVSVIGPMLALLLGERPDLSDFAFVREHFSGYLIALALAWVIGGFYEELVFRGFLHGSLMRWLPAGRVRSGLALTLTVLAFAAYHAQLGAFGVANALVFALFAGGVRSRWPANLWYVISFHACADMSAFTLLRLGYLS
ncbi:CPBP family intramembrane metalloprotease [Frateuria edaphi]|uniref:CPBP family intramembrane glutamic endopeptidase n=1 Tax=Frateuria edaphi TaxID=2898793 RepID=UPI001E49A13F|nr:CPBP family intramembrane glutamic endopeptidase [Frateuria edaphi]UGB45129.1 CPBP family intramembrane metalloprotease [Frateuria edaphi]